MDKSIRNALAKFKRIIKKEIMIYEKEYIPEMDILYGLAYEYNLSDAQEKTLINKALKWYENFDLESMIIDMDVLMSM